MTVSRSIHFLQPLSTLECLCTVSTIPFLLHLRKNQSPSRPQSLGQLHNHACTAAASMNLSLPFSPPSVPPVCFLIWPSVLLQQGLCTLTPPSLEVSSSNGYMIHSLILRCLWVSQGRFLQTLENSYQSILPPSSPPRPSVFSPCFIFAQSASSHGVTVFHSLLGYEELQESESCAVCCRIPRIGEGPAFGRCCTVFVRIMAGIFHFSGVNKKEYF